MRSAVQLREQVRLACAAGLVQLTIISFAAHFPATACLSMGALHDLCLEIYCFCPPVLHQDFGNFQDPLRITQDLNDRMKFGRCVCST